MGDRLKLKLDRKVKRDRRLAEKQRQVEQEIAARQLALLQQKPQQPINNNQMNIIRNEKQSTPNKVDQTKGKSTRNQNDSDSSIDDRPFEEKILECQQKQINKKMETLNINAPENTWLPMKTLNQISQPKPMVIPEKKILVTGTTIVADNRNYLATTSDSDARKQTWSKVSPEFINLPMKSDIQNQLSEKTTKIDLNENIKEVNKVDSEKNDKVEDAKSINNSEINKESSRKVKEKTNGTDSSSSSSSTESDSD